jgi:hypothetical protein
MKLIQTVENPVPGCSTGIPQLKNERGANLEQRLLASTRNFRWQITESTFWNLRFAICHPEGHVFAAEGLFLAHDCPFLLRNPGSKTRCEARIYRARVSENVTLEIQTSTNTNHEHVIERGDRSATKQVGLFQQPVITLTPD